MLNFRPKIIAVSLNPSVDRGYEVPNLTLGAHQVGRQVFRRPAGKAVNVAHILASLKIPTTVVGFVGEDQREYFETYLNDENLSCQLFTTAGRTRENVTLFDPVNRVETHIRDRGFDLTRQDIDKLRERLASICSPDTYVVYSGSLPPGFSADDFVELVRICQGCGAKVCVDSSGPALQACKGQGIWMMKPNAAEMGELLGRSAALREEIVAVGNELTETVTVIIVSLGAEGAVLISKGEILTGFVPLDNAEVKNTVGCGDAMLAGFLSQAARGKSLREAFIMSLAVATAAAASLTPGDVDPSDVERFLPRVRCEAINGS